jgi:hypothetical protein
VEQPETLRRVRRRTAIIPLLVFMSILVGLGALLLLRSRPEEAVRRLIDAQIKLARSDRPDRFERLHETLSPRAKAACPLESFQGALSSLPLDFWELIEYRDIRIEVSGGRALVTYVITYNGRPVERATAENPDVYVRATETLLGPKRDVEAELAALDRQQTPGPLANPLPPEEYRRQRAAIIDRGKDRPVLSEEGQWYDELDGHARCE